MPEKVESSFIAVALAAVATVSLACSFTPPKSKEELIDLIAEFKEQAPSRNISPQQTGRQVVYQAAGKIEVQHGRACAEPSVGAVKIHDRAAFPAGTNEGTVIFNGSVATYTGNDHHVQVLASGAIYDVEVRVTGTGRRELHWNVVGALADKHGAAGPGFAACYFYTLVFWNRGSEGLQAFVAPSFGGGRVFGEYGAPRAVHEIVGSLHAPSQYGGPRALLPRGHALSYSETDHHLLQAGYALGFPTIAGDTISWTSKTLLKDNDSWRSFWSAETVEVMNGPSVNMWQPTVVSRWVTRPVPHWAYEQVSFDLQPQAPFGNFIERCVASAPDAVMDHYSVEVPFTYAVPMLTGWEITEPCSDTHVRQIGAYIDNFSFVPYPNGRSGILRYAVVASLRDNGSGQVGEARNKVTILGLNPIGSNPFPGGAVTSPLAPVGNAR
jgi:hypothetical protein